MRLMCLLVSAVLCMAPAALAQRPKNVEDAVRKFEKVEGGDERNRHNAVRDLGKFTEDESTAVLLKELARAETISYRRTVIRAIGYKPRDGVNDALRDCLLAADNPRIADAAASALQRQGDGGVDVLAETLGDCTGKRVQRNAICYALGRVKDHDGARDALLADLQKASNRDRLPPLRGLEKCNDESVHTEREKLAIDGDPLVAATALEQLADLDHPSAVEKAVAFSRRLKKKAESDLHTAVLKGLLVQPTSEHYPLLFQSAAHAEAPFGKKLADKWRAVMADGAVGAWIAANLGSTKNDRERIACARALSFAAADHRERDRKTLILMLQGKATVVQAAANSLVTMQVVDPLEDLLRRGQAHTIAIAIGAVHAIKKSESDWQQQLLQLASHKQPAGRAAAMRALAEVAPVAGADQVAADNLAHKQWAVRAAAIELLAANRSRTCPPLLFARLDKEKARMRQDVLDALRDVTGQSFQTLKQWQSWWSKEADRFEPRPRKSGKPGRKGADATAATYWDIPVLSDRVAFIVDVSGSMREPFGTGNATRLDEAKRQLTRVFDRIPAKAKINLITFSDDAEQLFKKLSSLDKRRRKTADKFVAELAGKGPTNVHAALQLAFADKDVDTIFVLTDGHPSVGQIVDQNALADEVQRWNLGRGIRIHTVAIGDKSKLLERLAKDSGGEHSVAR